MKTEETIKQVNELKVTIANLKESRDNQIKLFLKEEVSLGSKRREELAMKVIDTMQQHINELDNELADLACALYNQDKKVFLKSSWIFLK